MHRGPKYTVTSNYGADIPLNEPCFVIRSKDIFAPIIVEKYIEMVRATVSPMMIGELEYHLSLIRTWQRKNKPKIPD